MSHPLANGIAERRGRNTSAAKNAMSMNRRARSCVGGSVDGGPAGSQGADGPGLVGEGLDEVEGVEPL